MRTAIALLTASTAAAGAAVAVWRRDPRTGSAFVNTTVDPWLLHHGLAGGRHSEIASLEHIGRRSGLRRLTPVRPSPTPEGFRVMVPLGTRSEWARNVIAAGHCRLQLHGQVYELAEPILVSPDRVSDLPRVVRRVMARLGFEYLNLRMVGVELGSL